MIKHRWTLELCRVEALKHNRRVDFLKACGQAYRLAHKNNWLDDICSHMQTIKKPNNFWTKERCHVEALKYHHRSKFREESSNVYNIASKKGWLSEICSHMGLNRKIRGYWNYQNCKKEAVKYESKSKFKTGCSGAYDVARKNKWLDKFFPK